MCELNVFLIFTKCILHFSHYIYVFAMVAVLFCIDGCGYGKHKVAALIVRLTHNNLDIVGKSNKVCFANCVLFFFFLNHTVFCFQVTVNRNGHTGGGPGGVYCVRVFCVAWWSI